MELRRVRPDERALAAELAALFADAGARVQDGGAWIADPAHVMVAAFEDGRPVGMAYGYRLPRPDARPAMLLLYSLDVMPLHRNRGIGRALARAFAAEGPDGAWLVTNASNEPAMRAYAAAGGVRPHPDDVLFRLPRPT